MIIVANHNGQTGNRIVLFLHSLATAIDTKQPLWFIFGADVRKACTIAKCRGTIRVWCPHVSALHLWRWGLFALRKVFGISPFSVENRRRYMKSLPDRLRTMAALPHRFHGVFFWDFKNNDALVRHRDEILLMVRFRPEFLKKADAFLEPIRQRKRTVVGVHVRRGDYRQFHGGKFLFELVDWVRLMNSFLEGESDNSVAFVLVSDESIPCDELSSLGFKGDAFKMPNGNAFEDMALLSRCDLVMGVPSTFSWCAAFLGNRPLLVLRDRDAVCKRNRFRTICGDEYRIQEWGIDKSIYK